jgi:hypothetical protein
MTTTNTSEKPPVPILVKVSHVAKILSVSKCTVHKMIECGDLRASEINPEIKAKPKKKTRRHVRVTRKSLLALYRKRFGHSLQDALVLSFEFPSHTRSA